MSTVKRRSKMLQLFLVALGLSNLSGLLSSAMADTSVALWQGNKKAAVSMTFDDGLLSQYNNAFPVLKQEGLKGTFYIISGSYDENMVLALADDGQEIGSHSYSHSDLEKLPESPEDPNYWKWDYELSDSQVMLNAIVDQEIAVFAYPYGRGWIMKWWSIMLTITISPPVRHFWEH